MEELGYLNALMNSYGAQVATAMANGMDDLESAGSDSPKR
jgi:hypothetical protein